MLIRHPENPILTRLQIPTITHHLRDVTSVFKPGAVQFEGEILLLLRVQNRARETCLLTAVSPDGINFTVSNKPVEWRGLEQIPDKIHHFDDPRITHLSGRYNILEPRELYGQVGHVPNVVFPSGLIVEESDDAGFAKPESRVFIYYGAADTCVGLATTTIIELIKASRAGS